VQAALGRRPILVAPTGSGKTVMAVALVKILNRRTLWLAHRKELIEQASAHLESLGLYTGIILSGVRSDPLASVQVASVQTLNNRDNPPADLVVVDECHHVTGQSYRSILEAYPNAAIVGLTATPFRLDGRGLGDVFGEIVIAAYTDDLCADGTLHEPRVYAGATPDLRGVKTSMGDYAVGELGKRTNRPELNADVVETWQRHAQGKRTVAFAVDVEHSRAICDAFASAGVRAAHLDGTTPKSERERILHNLRSGFIDVVSNCMVLTEGWDLPALECAIVARPTASLNLHLQMLGRIMRAADGKTGAVVLDHAGNHHIHGRVTRRITYSLDGRIAGESDPLGLRRCHACQLLFDPRETECPECGWKPEPATGRERPAIHGAGALTEFDDTDYAYRAEMWRLFEAQREAAGYKPGWSAFRFNERFGEWPVLAGGELVDVAHATREQKREVYSRFVEIGRAKGFREGWASHRYRSAFGVWPSGFVGDVRGDVRGDARERITEKLKGA
jgi:rubredoxin